MIELKETKHLLQGRGVPARTLGLFKPFDLERICSQYQIVRRNDSGEEETRPVMPSKQIGWLKQVFEDPYHLPYILYLSDYKNGDLSRGVAAAILSEAMSQFSVSTHKGDRPLWVRLHQGFDWQVDFENKPSLLVLDNVFLDSTPVKVEKLRDILSICDGIPIIVIVSSGGSPLALSEKFNLPATYGALLRDTRTSVKTQEL